MKTALITGGAGFVGRHLTRRLLSLGYKVYIVDNFYPGSGALHLDQWKLKDLDIDNLHIIFQDCRDFFKANLEREADDQFDEVYHLAAQSHVQVSFDLPEYTCNVDALGTLKLLEAIKICDLTNHTRFYNATTSELFGQVQEVPQKETTPFYPRSPYGVAKLYSYWIAKNYREAYGMFICNGILFNHTSSRRGENFVCRKITIGAAKIVYGLEDELVLGNLDSQRDIGHAEDYVYGMWLMLQHDKPDDYVLSTGKMHKIREIVEIVFKQSGYEIEWQGSGVNEVGVDKNSGKVLVRVDEKYFRPSEVDELLGDATKAKTILKWEPKHDIHTILSDMIYNDMHEYLLKCEKVFE